MQSRLRGIVGRRRLLIELVGVLGIALVAAFACFHRMLLGHGYYVALDLVSIHVPFRFFIERSLAHGRFPLWMPDLWMGAPFVGNGDAALLYPANLPLLLLSAVRGYDWELWLHTGLSMVTVFAFCRLSLGLRPAAAAAAGAAFAFGGYSLAHTGLPWAVYEAPWPPLLFLAVERGINGPPAWGWLGPIAVALALAGNPQEMYYS